MPINLEPILEEVLAKAKIVGILVDKENIKQLLIKEINGDDLTVYLVIKAAMCKDQGGLLVYLLTTAKIIEIQIDKEKFECISSYLKEVTGIIWSFFKDPAGKSGHISVKFLKGSFELRYYATAANIDFFFKKVDETFRKINVTTNGI